MKKYKVKYRIATINFEAENMEDAKKKCREYGIILEDAEIEEIKK